MSPLLPNYSFLSPLKRQRAVRNRSNDVTPTPSSRANRLPVTPELFAEQEFLYSTMCSFVCSTIPPPLPISSKEKRLSRYGKDQFAFRGGSAVVNESQSTLSPTRSRAPSSSVKQMHRSVRLSTFDIFLDASASEPASPISETSFASSISTPRPRDRRTSSPRRTRSPTPSLTSMSACSSTEMPTTPGASDDEWSGPHPSSKAIARPPISAHPYAASAPSLPISESPSDTFHFTLESFFPLGPEDEESEEEKEDEEDIALWYSRELGEVISFFPPRVHSSGPARPESFLSPARSSSTGADRPTGRSRMSKPLPDLPPTAGPSAHMDPTFPQSKSRPSPPPLPSIRHLAPSPSHLAPPRPAVPTTTLEARKLPSPPTYPASRVSLRRKLSIVVPRALPSTQLPLDVSDILDDIDAWSFATPSTSTHALSPPRVPCSPAPSSYSAEYDPIELIVSYASEPHTPTLSTPTVTCAPSKEVDESAETEMDWDAEWDDNKFRSRWSCSTLATVAPTASSPRTPTSASARFRMHLGTVARLVRARRSGAGVSSINGGEDAATVPKAATHVRSVSESALSSPVHDSEAGACTGLQRKPIPLELFSL